MTVDSAANSSQQYEDRAVRWFLFAMATWGLIAAALTILLSLLLVMPKLFYELGDSAQHFGFGRLYPMQIQVLIYGFIANGFSAFTYFAAQRLANARLTLIPLSLVHWLAWQALLVMTIIATFDVGTSGEWLGWGNWSYSFAMIAIWGLLFIPPIVMTLRQRPAHTRMPPALWFIIATMLAIPWLLKVSNFHLPSQAEYQGVQEVMMQWWTTRGFVSYWITVPAVAVLYHLVPRVSDGKLHSHRLTVIHFWSIVLLGCWGGNFQWYYTVLPAWVESLAMFAGLLLWLGCLGGAYNLWRSLSNSTNRQQPGPVRRLIAAAVFCYGIYTIDSGLMSWKGSSSTTQFTDWFAANQMLGILGVTGLSVLAFFLLEVSAFHNVGTDSKRGRLVAWFAIPGAVFQFVGLYVAGQLQAYSWNHLNDLGRLEYPEFVYAFGWVRLLWILVTCGAIVWFLAILCWFVLIIKTFVFSDRVTTPVGSKVVDESDPVVIPSRLEGAPVLGAAIGLEHWGQFAWHARIERHGVGMAIRVVVALLIGTALIWLPSFLYRGSITEADAVTQSPYSELELMGREIYVREGCVSCHTQASRPLVAEVLRYGDFSRPTDYVHDQPVQIGTRRVGPDLAQQGGRQTSLWLWQHLENPQQLTPESVMPSFDFVLLQPLEAGDNEAIAKQAETIAADIVSTGGPVIYGDNLLMHSRGLALIAYLQRLGAVVAPPSPPPTTTGTPTTGTPQ